MWRFHHPALRLLFVAAGLFPSVNTAYCQQGQAAEKSVSPNPLAPPPANQKAEETIKQAIERWSRLKSDWIETKVWQQARLQDVTLHGEGQYILGPNNHVRADLSVKLGNLQGDILNACDGKTVWNRMRIGEEIKGLSKWDLKSVQSVLEKSGADPNFIAHFYNTQAFAGLFPLLQALRQNMVFTAQESARLRNREVLKLTAVWSAEVAKASFNPQAPRPNLVPQKCVLYLEKLQREVLWPARIEWWGPVSGGADAILLEMEFRDPQIIADPKRAERLAKLCEFDPGKATVMDQTRQLSESLEQMRRQAPKSIPNPASPAKK